MQDALPILQAGNEVGYEMQAITVSDRDEKGVLTFDLLDLLRVIADEAADLEWVVRDVECFGESADAVHSLSDTGSRISGTYLLQTARGVDQVVEGRFYAYDPGGSRPTLLLRAVDSSCWDIATDRVGWLDRFRDRFEKVEDVEGEY